MAMADHTATKSIAHVARVEEENGMEKDTSLTGGRTVEKEKDDKEETIIQETAPSKHGEADEKSDKPGGSASSTDSEDTNVPGICEEALESAYKSKLYKQVKLDQRTGKHDKDNYEKDLQREYEDIVIQNRMAVILERPTDDNSKKSQNPKGTNKSSMTNGTKEKISPDKPCKELVKVKKQPSSKNDNNAVAIPAWKGGRKQKMGTTNITPKHISDEEVRALYRESLLMDELEAMVEEKKQEELRKRARKNPIVQTGPTKATAVKPTSGKPRAESGRLLLKNPTMDDIMNAIANISKDNEDGEEIEYTARVYTADELTEEERRRFEENAVDGVYAEEDELPEENNPKKKNKSKKKASTGAVGREEPTNLQVLNAEYKKIKALEENGPIITKTVRSESKKPPYDVEAIGRVRKVIRGKKGRGGKRGTVVVATVNKGSSPRIGDYKGAYDPKYWKDPVTPAQPAKDLAEDLLTFSRQKLALIKCEYVPKCCNYCEKYSPSDKLKMCDRCRIAKYCSRECQVKDWERKHKPHCKEIKRLKEIIRREEHLASLLEEKQKAQGGAAALIKAPSQKPLKPTLLGEPWLMNMGITCSVMCVQGEWPVIYCVDYLNNVERYIQIYNPVTGDEEDMVCRFPLKDIITGITACTIKSQDYIAISSRNLQQYSEIELWPFPLTWKPTCAWMGDFETCGTICFYEGMMYMANKTEECVMELDASSTDFVPTGLRLSTDIPGLDFVQSLCVTRLQSKEGKPKIMVIQYRDVENESKVLCMDLKGQHLWTIIDLPLDGIIVQPSDICADERGHIFAGDPMNNRVIVIKEDLTIETLIHTPEQVRCMFWSEEVQQLYVCTFNKKKTLMMFARFRLDEI